MVALALLLLAASPPPLAQAKAHLAQGHPDALVLDLADDVELAAPESAEAGKLLVDAGRKALAQKDPIIALQLAQMAHRRAPEAPEPLALLAELALADSAFAEAERWADAWRQARPSDAQATLLRAKIAAAQGDWGAVSPLVDPLARDKGQPAAVRKLALELGARAKQAQPEAVTSTEALEARLREAAAAEREAAFAGQQRGAAEVVLYGTSWCRYCKTARDYFTRRGIAFADKDIEQDHEAARELMAKARAVGIQPRGVPVIDVHGTLVQGFDKRRIEELLPP